MFQKIRNAVPLKYTGSELVWCFLAPYAVQGLNR